jgi:hypothetical protein
MPAAPRTLAELPFDRHEPLALLGLQAGADGRWRREPDPDYAVFGWAEADVVVLEAGDGTRQRVEHVLVLALHSTDVPSPDDTVIELELDLPDPDGAEPLVIRAPLDRFLSAWLPRLPATAPHVVLALCNPRHLDPARPPELGARHLHYAYGDVLSWLDTHDDAPPEIRLHAHTWHRR